MCLIYNESDGLLLCLLYLFVLRIMINKVFIKKMKKISNFYTFSSYLVIILRSENDYNRFAILCKKLFITFKSILIFFDLFPYIYVLSKMGMQMNDKREIYLVMFFKIYYYYF